MLATVFCWWFIGCSSPTAELTEREIAVIRELPTSVRKDVLKELERKMVYFPLSEIAEMGDDGFAGVMNICRHRYFGNPLPKSCDALFGQ